MTKLGGLTSRKRHAAYVRRAPFRDAKLIVIATEGAVTEPHYFSLFSDRAEIFFNPRVRRIDILHTTDGKSAPGYVIDRLLNFKRDNDINDDDQLWLVIDVDRWKIQGVLDPVIAQACQEGILLAISNPCFEVWLLCHFIEDLSEIGDFNKLIKEYLGNVKSKFDLSKYVDRVRHATSVAQKSSVSDDPNIPNVFGTNVYKLILQILHT